MKVALIVGIDYYEKVSSLAGCVNDAKNIKTLLERNGDGTINFECKLLTAENQQKKQSKHQLKASIKELFEKDAEIALFFFAGHGHVEEGGGYLITSDSNKGDDGVSLTEIITFANNSPAKNKIIILDSCHSGAAGVANILDDKLAVLSEGITILTASTQEQYAMEKNGGGVFTNLLLDALEGSAANLTGDITPGSVYAHIDQSLGAWEQRPLFKTNIKRFVSLRKVNPPITLQNLKRIAEFFPNKGFEFQLNPTYEPEMKGRDEGMPLPIDAHTKVFTILQKYNRLNLLVPIDVPNMWNAAMESKRCKLTALGEHYRKLVEKGRI